MGARVPPASRRQPPLSAQRSTQRSTQRPAPVAVQVEHHFFPPSPLLAAFVNRFWIHQSAPQARSRVLPTGTAQLIVDLSGDGLSLPRVPDVSDPASSAGRRRDTRGTFRDTLPALLHGADTIPFPLETDRPLFQVGIDFHPGGTYPFFAPPACELQNAHVSLDLLWGRQQVADLRDRLAAAGTLEECAGLLEDTLVRQLVRPLHHHPAVALALCMLSGPAGFSAGLAGPASLAGPAGSPREDADVPGADPAQIHIRQVAEAAGFSAGHFRRLFQEEVGLTPKQFARVRRFRTVLRRAHAEQKQQRVHWVQLAADCGYYDQAHLTKDFQAFAGVSPSAYLRTRRAYSPSTLPLAD